MRKVTADLLAAITASARKSADVRERAGDERTREAAAGRTPRGAEFLARLRGSAGGHAAIIAECKRRSPSRGILRHPYDPVAIASGYETAGAAAISILTEPTFFDGALGDLSAVREHTRIPLLRKDFIATPFQVLEARAAGADAVLLIVGALDRQLLAALMAEAGRQELTALVEVHSREELLVALDAGAALVGINSRNLKTLDVDLRVFDDLIDDVPDHVTAVAESGLREAADLRRLRSAGYDAFLIGERFMTTPNPGEVLAELLAASRGGPE
jgi:indole-3-glycerol phosphate synthase